MANGPIIQGKDGLLEWSAPIDYGSVVFHGGGLFPNAGTFYHDASARKNNGALLPAATAPAWEYASELSMHGQRFSGANYTHVGNVDSLDIRLSDWTVAAWMKCSAAGTQYFLSKARAEAQIGRYGLAVRATTGYAGFLVQYGEPSLAENVVLVLGTTAINDGNWHHVLGAISRASTQRIYVDGELQGSADVSAYSAADLDTPDPFRLGTFTAADGTSMSTAYTGLTASSLVVRGALSPPQIDWLRNRANNPWQPWRRKSWPVVGGAPVTGNRRRRLLLAGAY